MICFAGDGQGIAIMDSIVYNYYFSYYKQDDIWHLSEDAGGNFTTEKRHEHVQYTDTFAYYYIDNNSNLCINGYYVTGAGDSIRPTNGIKIVANDVIQCFGAEGGSYGYLTKNGDLYYTGIDVKDLSRGCAEAGVI